MRILNFLLLFTLGLTAGYAQQAETASELAQNESHEQLRHKITMVGIMLNSPEMLKRMESSDDPLAKELLARAAENYLEMDEYFDRGQFLEAEAIIDYVLRDLSAASQLMSVSTRKKSVYLKSIEQLDSFVLPEWKQLTIEEKEFLQTTLEQIKNLRAQAVRLAQAQELDEATDLLAQAYRLKTTLIEKLQHEQTVIYELAFGSIEEEYDYLNKRTYHYLELVEFALLQEKPTPQTRKLIDDYIYRSVVNLQAAENFKSQDKLKDGISSLDKSIRQLTSVLKLLGIKI